MLVKLIGTTGLTDGVTTVTLAPAKDGSSRELLLDGDELEVTDEEYARLAGRFQLEVLDGAEKVTASESSDADEGARSESLVPPATIVAQPPASGVGVQQTGEPQAPPSTAGTQPPVTPTAPTAFARPPA